jgi:hypothetical protein
MHRVVTREDWSRVRALRCHALASHGDIEGCDDRAAADTHDFTLNGSTFLLTRHGRAVGSTRSTLGESNRRCSLPAMDVYPREVESAIGLECTVVEASLMVVDPTAGDPRVPFLHLLKAHMLQCASEDADWLVAAVRESEIGFHRRMLGMEILSGPEAWPGMAMPRVLMGLQYREQEARLVKRFPMLAVTPADKAEYAATGVVRFAQPAMSQQAA